MMMRLVVVLALCAAPCLADSPAWSQASCSAELPVSEAAASFLQLGEQVEMLGHYRPSTRNCHMCELVRMTPAEGGVEAPCAKMSAPGLKKRCDELYSVMKTSCNEFFPKCCLFTAKAVPETSLTLSGAAARAIEDHSEAALAAIKADIARAEGVNPSDVVIDGAVTHNPAEVKDGEGAFLEVPVEGPTARLDFHIKTLGKSAFDVSDDAKEGKIEFRGLAELAGGDVKIEEAVVLPDKPESEQVCGANSIFRQINEKDYTCECQAGYEGAAGKDCVNRINPCKRGDFCSEYAQCAFTGPGLANCTCKVGYSGNGKTCQKIDVCTDPAMSKCSVFAECNHGATSHVCTCNSGYSGDGMNCAPLNQCAFKNGGCAANAMCVNAGPGVAHCHCAPGFTGDGMNCFEYNFVCRKSNGGCSKDANCTDLGGFLTKCTCHFGYTGTGAICEPINNCEMTDPVYGALHNCPNGSKCVFLGAAEHKCECLQGYQKIGMKNNSADEEVIDCELVNRCDSKNFDRFGKPCHANATCTPSSNFTKGADCKCNQGFTGNGKTCLAIDACLVKRGGCSRNANCTMTGAGMATCTCHSAYSGNGVTCEPRDACKDLHEGRNATGHKVCHEEAICTPTGPLEFDCNCREGFVGNGTECREKLPCDPSDNGGCPDNSICTPVGPTKVTCKCKAGFRGFARGKMMEGVKFIGLDECAPINNCDKKRNPSITPCMEHSVCRATGAGTHKCACQFGYKGDGIVQGCTVRDTCKTENGGCDKFAKCINTEPGYVRCKCLHGFTGNGMTCNPLEPCSLSNGGCNTKAICIKTGPRNSTCKCKGGYKGDGVMNCDPIDLCNSTETNPCDKHANCKKTAPGIANCTCAQGFVGNGYFCKPKSPCDVDNGLCEENAKCGHVSANERTCTCNTGYQGDGIRFCALTAPCSAKKNDCSPKALCMDDATTGTGFNCTCKDGFVGYGRDCKAVDACAAANSPNKPNGGCHAFAMCIPSGPTKRKCECIPNYEGDGLKCRAINPCKSSNGGCSPDAKCDNYGPNERQCSCNAGYSGTGLICESAAICTVANPCDKNGMCIEIGKGRANCTCKGGYIGDGFKGSCLAIDRCEDGSHFCDDDANCTFTKAGEYTCKCLSGFSGLGKSGDCAPINPCEAGEGEGSHNCHLHANCLMGGPGNHTCKCRYGYAGNGTSCTPINPCLKNNGMCHSNATCNMTGPGGNTCKCQKGFSGDGLKSCEYMHLCAARENTCDPTAFCNETGPGSRKCDCPPLHVHGDDDDQKSPCIPIDPCGSKWGGCSKNADCQFLGPAKHKCACNEGFLGNGQTCVDPGLCAVNNGGCDSQANCTKRGSGVKCICRPGYTGSGQAAGEGSSSSSGCAPIDPCSVDWGMCSLNAKCTLLNASMPFTNNCSCNVGFKGDGKVCREMNPCTDNATGCDMDAHCLHIKGADFQCLCNDGFKGSGFACRQITTCQVDCDQNAYCKQTETGQKCMCKNGFSGNGTVCEEINNCELNNGECNEHALCSISGPGSSTCKCKKGFTGNGDECSAINMCLKPESAGCHANSSCFYTGPGKWNCKCNGHYSGNGVDCKEIQNCDVNHGNCSGNATCAKAGFAQNTCSCNVGYSGDGKMCDVIDNCALNETRDCADDATCKYVAPGVHSCKCLKGFRGNGRECAAINPCNGEEPFLPHGGCAEFANCNMTGPAQHTCACKTNYSGNGVWCSPINPCDEFKGWCSPKGKCKNTAPGRSTCKCPFGYTGSGMIPVALRLNISNDTGVLVVPEVNSTKSYCSLGGKIGSTEVKMQCHSDHICVAQKAGICVYSDLVEVPDFKGCEAINPCEVNNGSCSVHAKCLYLYPGTHSCQCIKGFKGDGVSCSAINSCNIANGGCDSEGAARCIPTGPNNNTCKCRKGYKGDGVDCDVVNNCDTNNGNCSSDAECVYMGPGQSTCKCMKGYTGNGVNCSVANLCKIGSPCSVEADCTMAGVGKVNCACKAGYEGNGQFCSAINTCLNATGNGCDMNSECSPTGAGSRKCVCNEGFQGDGKFCSVRKTCAGLSPLPDCNHNAACLPVPMKVSGKATGAMKPTCVCKQGFLGSGIDCKAVNPCSTDYGNCDQNSQCHMTAPGKKQCRCNTGYQGDGTSCEVQDPCTLNNGDCVAHAKCKLTYPGHSKCACEFGYNMLDGLCVAIDLCEANNGACHKTAKCTKTGPGVRDCTCASDHFGDGITCGPLNNCKANTHDCDDDALCIFTGPGSHRCTCNPGYSGSGRNCVPINVCQMASGNETCDSMASCAMTAPGKWNCSCNVGFTGDGKNCVVADKCDTENGGCDDDAICMSTGAGTNNCTCKTGFIGDGLACQEVDPCAAVLTLACLPEATCNHTGPGQYRCDCPKGFNGDGVKSCKANDRCTFNNGDCPRHSMCRATAPGQRVCSCKPDYLPVNGAIWTKFLAVLKMKQEQLTKDVAMAKLIAKTGLSPQLVEPLALMEIHLAEVTEQYADFSIRKPTEEWEITNMTIDKKCVAANPCKVNHGDCSPDANCTFVSAGQHMCTCKRGFKGTGEVCNYKNPCLLDNGGCSEDAACTNTGPNERKCVCKNGWSGDGVECYETNPCEVNNGGCDPWARCQKVGALDVTCSCPRGYSGNGKVCFKRDGHSSTDECIPNYKMDHGQCQAIKKCEIANGGCSKNSNCLDIAPNKAMCICKQGYEGDGYVCREVDVCSVQNLCDENANCTNLGRGQQRCSCNEGYMGDGYTCSDFAPCDYNKGGCDQEATCKSVGPGVRTCACRFGFTGDGKTCAAIRLCEVGGMNGGCSKNATCEQTSSNVTCVCKPGFEGTGYHCAEIDACLDNGGCHKDATCEQVGLEQRMCSCKKGFRGDGFECAKMKKDGCKKRGQLVLEPGYKGAVSAWAVAHEEDFASAFSTDVAAALQIDATAVTVLMVKPSPKTGLVVQFEIEDSNPALVEKISHMNPADFGFEATKEACGKPVTIYVGIAKENAMSAITPDTRKCKGEDSDPETAKKTVGGTASVKKTKGNATTNATTNATMKVTKPLANETVSDEDEISPIALVKKVEPNVAMTPQMPLWGNWSKFGACSKTCGGGFKLRTRQCQTPPGKKGLGCLGAKQEIVSCNNQCCPIMGQNTKWSEWSECTKPCAGGMQYRSRHCEGAKCGGRCYGQKTEARACNNFCCAVHSEVEKEDGFGFGNFSKCSQDCSGGIKFQVKAVKEPKCGGKLVQEVERVVVKGCNQQPCNVDGAFGAWEPWEKCSEPKQEIKRKRYCNAPHAQGGGNPCLIKQYGCKGPSIMDRPCNLEVTVVNEQTEVRLCNHDWERWLEATPEAVETELEAVSEA